MSILSAELAGKALTETASTQLALIHSDRLSDIRRIVAEFRSGPGLLIYEVAVEETEQTVFIFYSTGLEQWMSNLLFFFTEIPSHF